MKPETRPVAADDARDFAFGEFDEEVWREVEEEMYDQNRWQTHYRRVYHDATDDTYWEFFYSLGSTEMQEDERDFDDHMTRVYPHEVVRTEYRRYPASKE